MCATCSTQSHAATGHGATFAILFLLLHAERTTTGEVKRWLDEAIQEGRADTADRVGPIAAALQRLSEEIREERAQAAEVAGDYTPHQLQVLPSPALPCPAMSGLTCKPNKLIEKTNIFIMGHLHTPF